MAEAATTEDREGALPEKGKVESVCKKWLVHEDGVLAYKLQNEEMDFHYGLNRYNRRTVREDIPVAKLVQSEEEIRQQRERMEQLMLLKTQAEEDEKVAASVMREIDMEDAVHKMQSELHDEDYARKMQEKEKRRFERWHREQELKKERLRLEQELARHSEEARLVINKDDGGHTRQPSGDTDNVSHETEASPVARVTSGGRIEDDGDFSDFYIPPAEHMEEGEKKQLQELQDEELARLLQEQEHKRTKAEVDQDKLRQIEQQDAQLARIIHEQDKLKAKKAKQRKQKSMDEARRQRSQHEAQRSQSVDEGVRGGGDMTPGGVGDPGPPRSPHSSAGTPGSQRSYRDQNGSYEEHLSQRISPASPQSPQQGQIRSPPLYEHRHHRESPPPLPQQSAHEVERWLTGNHSQPHSQSPPSSNQRAARRSHDQQRMRRSPSPPGSFHSEDSAHETHRPQLSQSNSLSQQEPNPVPFNIAMAIDPTYRASPQDAHQMGRTREAHPPVTQSHSYPATTGHTVYEDEPEEDYDQDDPNWAPVQGQRRTNIERGKKVGKKTPKKGSSCKQQ